MTEIKDQLNRILQFKSTPTKIISLVPSLTELLVDLHLEDQLIGITKFCVHPVQLRKTKTIIGGTKQVNYKKILALTPDFIITNKEENTPEIIAELEKIAPVYVSDITHIKDMKKCINDIGIICNRQVSATQLISDISQQLAAFNHFMEDKPIRKVAYFIWHNPWMVVGQDTFINTVLQLNKFENIIKIPRYPTIELAELKEASPDLILLSSEPYPFKSSYGTYFTSVAKEDIMIVNGEFFSWYGSRFLKALPYFRSLHH